LINDTEGNFFNKINFFLKGIDLSQRKKKVNQIKMKSKLEKMMYRYFLNSPESEKHHSGKFKQ